MLVRMRRPNMPELQAVVFAHKQILWPLSCLDVQDMQIAAFVAEGLDMKEDVKQDKPDWDLHKM